MEVWNTHLSNEVRAAVPESDTVKRIDANDYAEQLAASTFGNASQ